MATRPTSAIPAAALNAYDRLIATQPDVERKGATLPYTSINGNMFSFLDASGSLALRLSKADREAFIARYRTSLHVAHAATMKEYVSVPDGILTDTDELRPWFEAGYRHAAGLKAKARRVRLASASDPGASPRQAPR